MTQQNWFFKKDGHQHGPVPAKELKQLADAGRIEADDLVRNESTEKWVRAKSVKGLIRVEPTAGPPPLPKKASQPEPVVAAANPTLLEKLKSSASEIADATKNAGVVAARQAEMARIKTVDLPRAYSKLGEEIRRQAKFRSDFPDIHQRIDGIEKKHTSIQDAANSISVEEGVSGKAKSLARKAKLKAEEGTLRVQKSQAVKDLGESAFQLHGKAAGESSLVSQIETLQSRVNEIVTEIETHEDSASSSFLRPKRLVLVGAACVGLLLMYIAISTFSSTGDSTADSSKLREGVANYAALFSDKQQGKPIENHVGKTVVVSGVSFAKGEHESGSQISIECQDGMVAMCRFKAPDAWKGDRRQFSIAGTFSEVFIRGQFVLTDCQIVDLSSLKPEAQTPPPLANAIELATQVGTTLETPRWIEQKYNPSIKDLKGHKTDTSIVLDFDVETSMWMEANWLLPLVINLYDADGGFITRFETDERFTVDQSFHVQCRQAYESDIRRGIPNGIAAKNNSSLLKSSGNRLEYQVSYGVLRDTAVVQIGFYQSK
ncbi:DUF4339 domain-containing protein [Rubripirellula reticaptiva]|uniref:GYF domain-containing protein n=1 Tax=Rubripirellula reticaptiva TaxID=2528013 RepID=A0A5C6EPJ6_9BACT|nr:DUF4339 domain-containing protein [Rubripirellula reticaptiva]TWU49259.1 hypothetical protein Poly59_38730 [Rubripirellula reticaptiva]